MKFFKEKWKHSKVRFYIKNTLWNYKFWLFCKKKYKTINYVKHDIRMLKRENISKRRFEGYIYKGKTYLDNPGLPIKENNIWNSLKKKGVI